MHAGAGFQCAHWLFNWYAAGLLTASICESNRQYQPRPQVERREPAFEWQGHAARGGSRNGETARRLFGTASESQAPTQPKATGFQFLAT